MSFDLRCSSCMNVDSDSKGGLESAAGTLGAAWIRSICVVHLVELIKGSFKSGFGTRIWALQAIENGAARDLQHFSRGSRPSILIALAMLITALVSVSSSWFLNS